MARELSGFTVFAPLAAGENFPRPLFVIRARTLAAAKQHAATLVVGPFQIFGPVSPRGPLAADIRRDPHAIVVA